MPQHLLTILEINHLDKDGTILYQEKNIKNTMHSGYELFGLSVLFNTSGSFTVPSNYYAGLDNRATISVSDTLSNLLNEPNANGYARNAISSSNGFNVALNDSNVYQATSAVLIYSASGGSWGPVSNIFLATTVDNTGYLLASSALSASRTLTDGQQMRLTVGVTLKDCP